MFGSRLLGTAALAALALSQACPASAASSLANRLGRWVGNYSCTDHYAKGKVSYSQSATAFGKWVRFDSDIPAGAGLPPRSSSFAMTYDETRHLWIALSYDSAGSYGVSKSHSEPISATKNGYRAVSSMKRNGKTLDFGTVCTKQ